MKRRASRFVWLPGDIQQQEDTVSKKEKKPPTKKNGREIPEAKLREIVERLQSGKATLIEESRRIGAKDNNRLRSALRGLLGRPGYEKMIGAGMKQRGAKPTTKKGKKKPAAAQAGQAEEPKS